MNAPVSGPAAWTGADFRDRNRWVIRFNSAEIAEIEQAGRGVVNLPLSDISKANFPLRTLAPRLARWRETLHSGCGFILLAGIPVERHGDDMLRSMYVGLGSHLGVSVSQSHRGDYLGDVIDWREDGNERPYRRGGELAMHRDPIDIVGLFCRRNAKSGGLSRIASSVTIWNRFVAERPDLLAPLLDGFRLYRPAADRGATGALSEPVPVFTRDADGRLDCWCIPDVIEGAVDKEGEPMSQLAREALDFFNSVANRPDVYLDMDLQPGDMQFLNNRVTVHSRTDYVDWPERDRKRHLFRLWLMCPDWPQPARRLYLFDNIDRAGGGIEKKVAATTA